jgi:hypothetical protein
MQTNKTGKSFILSSLLLITLLLSACGGKKQSDEVTPPVEQKAAVNCELWKKNQMFMSASYGLAQSKGDKIFINKLSILQLVTSLDLKSDTKLDELKTELIDKLEHAPANQDPAYTIEFTQPAISLRDRISIGIQGYIDSCP